MEKNGYRPVAFSTAQQNPLNSREQNSSHKIVHRNTIYGDIDSYGELTTACIRDSKHTVNMPTAL